MGAGYDSSYRQADYFGSEPSPLLSRFADWIPSGARVLDIGAGQGRNTLPLARSGCRVTALEPSAVGLEIIGERAAAENLAVELVAQDFVSYKPDGVFDVILCFGLIQILSYDESASLVTRLHQWLRSGGNLFLTAWHKGDPSFEQLVASWERLGIRSFRSPDGTEHRLFLEHCEILKLFFRWQTVHHWEGLGQEHRHGAGPSERHGEIEVVLPRP